MEAEDLVRAAPGSRDNHQGRLMPGNAHKLPILHINQKPGPRKEIRPQNWARDVGEEKRMGDVDGGETQLDGVQPKGLYAGPLTATRLAEAGTCLSSVEAGVYYK